MKDIDIDGTKDIQNDENFDITDHIIKKENTDWKEKWTHPNSTIYRMPNVPKQPFGLKSNEPWYRKFENNRKKGGKR